MKTTDVAIMLFTLVVLFACCTGCGPKITIQGGSTHTVQGEATVKVVVGVDVSICEGLDQEAKLECIKALVDLAKTVGAAKDQEETGFGGMY